LNRSGDTRGNAINAATRSRRDSTWRSAVYSVRCKPEIPEGLRKVAKSKDINLAEWFEGVADELIERGNGK
jgi:hypothetical protein